MEAYNGSFVECKYCTLKFPLDLLDDHNQVCQKKPKLIVPIKPYIKPSIKPYIKPGNKIKPLEPVHPIVDEPY